MLARELPEQNMAAPNGLSSHQLDLIVCRIEALPALPSIAAGVFEAISAAQTAATPDDRAAAVDRTVDLITCDPSLTAKLLSLAAGAAGPPVRGAAAAVEALGIEAVLTALPTTSTLANEPVLDCRGLWKHCLAVALAAEMIARQELRQSVDADEAYTCGLLHDLGKLVLDCAMPKSYRRALELAGDGDPARYEQEIIGAEHWAFGRRLAEQWRLPASVRDVAWLCDRLAETVPAAEATQTVVAVVTLADTIARELGLDAMPRRTPRRSSSQLAEQLGLSADALSEIVQQLPAALERRCASLGLDGGAAPAEASVPAAARTNIELAGLNERLRREAAELAGEAAAFRLLDEFAGALTDEASVPDVLGRIAELVSAAVGVEPTADRPVVAYSIGAAGETTLAGCMSGKGRFTWRTFSPEPGPETSAAPRSAAAAAAALAGQSEGIGQWIDVSAYAHQSLLSAGSWIGGVFYAPQPPEPDELDPAELCLAVAPSLALALGAARVRSRGVLVGEQLAGAARVLADAQAALAEAKALAAVGELAAGAAHELNTPLAVISGRAQLMRDRAKDEQERKTWDTVADQAQRISDTLSELMAFASPPEPQAGDFEPGSLLRDVAEAFGSGEHPQAASIPVDIRVAEDTPRCHADRRQMHDAILELVMNAANASKADGRIRLAAEPDQLDAGVLLSVSDDGTGMDEQTAERAFAPFFSWQKAGRRRGMGLPRVKRLIDTNGGRVWLQSKAGEGTTLYVRLPAARD